MLTPQCLLPAASGTAPAIGAGPSHRTYHGHGHEVLLQAFHWGAHAGGRDRHGRTCASWYRVVAEQAPCIAAAGFHWAWLPPPTDAVDRQGYLPRRWHVLDTAYGSERELREALRALGPVRALADVVVNHRLGVATGGADFECPAFPDNRRAVVRDDASGVGLGNHDTGEHCPCGRDLDHTNPDVRSAIVDQLRRLRALGFRGWRYDQSKGYHGRFVGEYNDATGPELSVGEFYDTDRQKVTDWINATGGKSAAFDFPTRYLLYDACRTDDYGRLRSGNGGRTVPGGLIGFWPSRAVTFVDNHDTEACRDEEHRREHNDTRHFPGQTAAMAYAYILTHPGIPCVFWPHFFDWGPEFRGRIEKLLRLRADAGVHSRSHVDIWEARSGLYAACVDGRVAVKLGSTSWSPGGGWRLAVDGERFAVWARG